MSTLQSTPEAGQLVRSYSLELESNLSPNVPAGDLRRVFIENERRLRREEQSVVKWREYYEPWEPIDENSDPTTKVLREQAVLLSHAWKVFRTTIPQNEQENLEGQVPSVSGLVGMVDSVAKEWQNKRATTKSGRFMQHFIGFCQTLDAHSYMLEVLPVGNEYVSLFTGVLKTVINASSNHEEVATKIGEALSRISAHVIQCEKEVRLHHTKAMLEKIANLYAHIFLYLQDTMEWYQKRVRSHIRDAFRQNFFDKFENTIINIQNLSQDLLREANVSSMAEIRQVRLTTENTLDEVKLGQFDARLSMDKVSRELAEIKFQYEQLQLAQQREAEERLQLQTNESKRREEFQKQIFLQIGDSVHQSFIGIAQQMLNDGYIRVNEQAHRPMGFIETSEIRLAGGNLYDRDDMILSSNRLLDIFSMISHEGPCKPPFGIVSLDTIATSRLKEWTTEPKIHFLAIAGRRSKGPEPPPMKVVASMCIEFAVRAELPVISYFCSLPPKEDLRDGNTPEVQELLSLTYALIRQLIERLPVQFSSKFDFGKERLALLEGTLMSWATTIALLRDLVKTVPKPLFCIVDGLQKLDDRNTEGLLEELVNVLKVSGPEGTETDHLDVLFTTTGKSRALLKCLDPRDYVLADRDGAAGGPARRAGSRRFIV